MDRNSMTASDSVPTNKNTVAPFSSNEALYTTTTIRTDGRLRRMHFVQNFVLVWLDANIDQTNEDFHDSLTQLRGVVNTIDTFTEINPCIEYLHAIKEVKIFLIISGSIGQTVVPKIHDTITQLDAIFVFCSDKEQQEQWTQDCTAMQPRCHPDEFRCRKYYTGLIQSTTKP
ncbi:hypothetical protein I4U23_010874 [Adineta vaga]|nr:hypothetical protein I4U23_010874 [Adineta vaga]